MTKVSWKQISLFDMSSDPFMPSQNEFVLIVKKQKPILQEKILQKFWLMLLKLMEMQLL